MTKLIWAGEGIRHLQIESIAGQTAKIDFILIDPGPSPTPMDSTKYRTNDLAETAKSASHSIAGVPKPNFVSRADWGCPEPNGRGTPAYAPVTHLIVHHTADGPVSDYSAWLRAIWTYHVNGNGWSDIGYNFLIAPDGTIFEGRAGGDNVIGAHFSCQNTGTMGVSLLGTFSNVQPPGAAVASLERLLAWQADRIDVDPLGEAEHRGSRLVLPRISSHRDGNDSPTTCTRTECPGNMLYSLLPQIRNNVAAILRTANPPVLLQENAESATNNWKVSGLWHRTTTRGNQSSSSFWYADPATGTYDTPGKANTGTLESPLFDMDADGTLRFWTWHETENPTTDWDQKWVDARVENGEWKRVGQLESIVREWRAMEFPIVGFRGKVQIRFRFDTKDATLNQFAGWLVDDIVVTK